MMKKTIFTLLVFALVNSNASWAKVPIRFPYKLFSGMNPDSVVSMLVVKGFAFDQSPLEGEDIKHYMFKGNSTLAEDIPVVDIDATFFLDQLVEMVVSMPMLADEDSHLKRLEEIEAFIEKTYFIDSTWVPQGTKLTERLDNINRVYKAGRMEITVFSSISIGSGYTLHLTYEDKRLFDSLVLKMRRKY